MTVKSALRDLNNAVLDLQSSDYNTYVRPLKRIAEALNSNDLKQIASRLKQAVDFTAFIEAADEGGSMIGSARLNWPIDREQELGLSVVLIEKGAEDPEWFLEFAYQYYYGGNKYFDSIRKIVASLIIPFSRDFTTYATENIPSASPTKTKPTDFQRVFIVHGHDEGSRETVARFVSEIGFDPVILHEQADRGMTIFEKLIANDNVGYAIVILTPDDLGRSRLESTEKSRARQNVILELGYFLGRLGRERVLALLRGEVEIPSDYMGVLYTPFDDGGAWRQKLAREMKTAGYEIDWNKVME